MNKRFNVVHLGDGEQLPWQIVDSEADDFENARSHNFFSNKELADEMCSHRNRIHEAGDTDLYLAGYGE